MPTQCWLMWLNWARVPLLGGVRELAAQGMVTGASGRNWAAYGDDITLVPGLEPMDQALLSDPQTSGGLPVSCALEAVDAVSTIFRRHGFDAAAEIGEIAMGTDAAKLRVR